MATCPNCKHVFLLERLKWSDEKKRKHRRALAWNHVAEIVEKYKSGNAIMWLADEYRTNKKIIRDVLKEGGITEFRGRAGIPAWNKGKEVPSIQGEKSPHWKGGVSPLNARVRRSPKYRRWVKIVLERDDWTCQICEKRGGNLEVDHFPKMFSQIMSTVSSYTEALNAKELWDTGNGRTLCVTCHNKTKGSSKLD